MSFDVYENSLDLGTPITLYQFAYGPGENDVLCYTDAEQDFLCFGKVFKAIPIERAEVTSSGTTDKTTMTVEMPLTEELPEMFRVYPPSYTVGLIIWQGHQEDPSKNFLVQWSGVVLNCAREEDTTAKLVCEPISVSFQRLGLRRNYQYMCPHVLYGPQCRANKAAATVVSAIASQAGRVIDLVAQLPSQAQFAGGLIEWVNANGQKEYRTILTATTSGLGATQLTLSGYPKDLTQGVLVSVSKGCPHTTDGCKTIHDNILNYGGQPFIPTKNPLGRSTPFL